MMNLLSYSTVYSGAASVAVNILIPEFNGRLFVSIGSFSFIFFPCSFLSLLLILVACNLIPVT